MSSGGGSSGTAPYVQAKARWYQTGFDSTPCAVSDSSFATWQGLGGWNSDRLLQAGTDVSQSSLNGIYMWWETIRPGQEEPEVVFGRAVTPGDHILSYTTYAPPSSTASAAVAFTVYNETTGYPATARMSGVNGAPIILFYDGSTADYITEASSRVGGTAYLLRKPHLNTTYFAYATSNGAPIADFPATRINTDSIHPNPDYAQTSQFDGVHAWSDVWGNCD